MLGADVYIELENERQTVANLNGTLAHIQRNLEKVRAQSTAVESEITAARKDVNGQLGRQERQRRILEQMRSRDEEELRGLQETLGLQIHGVRGQCACDPRCGADHGVDGVLLMRYTLLDPADPDREFSLLLDVSQDSYTGTSPLSLAFMSCPALSLAI